MNNDEYKDIIIWDEEAILIAAKDLVHSAFLARQRGEFELCSTLVTRALTTLGDCEDKYPKAVAALRGSLERL